jgi:Pyruvate/2-oxoacid:ferredoxin oxidoreductase delta subunit
MYVVAVVDEEKCIGCKMCIQTCPEPNAIKLIVDRKKACVISARCKGCGLCEVTCPKKAIALKQVSLAAA